MFRSGAMLITVKVKPRMLSDDHWASFAGFSDCSRSHIHLRSSACRSQAPGDWTQLLDSSSYSMFTWIVKWFC